MRAKSSPYNYARWSPLKFQPTPKIASDRRVEFRLCSNKVLLARAPQSANSAEGIGVAKSLVPSVPETFNGRRLAAGGRAGRKRVEADLDLGYDHPRPISRLITEIPVGG